MLAALDRRGWTTVVGIECPYGDRAFVADRFASRLAQHDAGIAWRPYFRPGDGSASASRDAAAACARIWRSVAASPDFDASLRHKGVRLAPALAETFRRAFRFALPDCAAQLAAATSILDDERPDAVMAVYENGPFARALILEAGRRGIPSIGLQHGTIFPNHYDYMHEGIVQASQARSGFVVPDVTCVWGSAWRDTLVGAGHYPPDAVAVTGNWRYDELPRQLRAIDVGALRHRLGLGDDVAIAAILSSGQGTVDYVAAALDAVQSRSGVAAVIRLHPSDDAAPVRAELARRGLPDSVMPRMELIELLALARVVVTQWSTVVAEAALVGRDIVLVNLQGLPGGEAYVDAGICVAADDAPAIRSAMTRVLDDEPTRRTLAVSREQFVDRFFHRRDGRAAERVADVLEGRAARRRGIPAAVGHAAR
jgi:hypothetical protein